MLSYESNKVSLNKLHETVTEWFISTTKLKDKYEIDLLADKYSQMSADTLLKKFDINVKSKIIEHLNDDYPGTIKIIEAFPIIIKCMYEAQGQASARFSDEGGAKAPRSFHQGGAFGVKEGA